MDSITKSFPRLFAGAFALASLLLPAWAQGESGQREWDFALLDNCESTDNTASIGTHWSPRLDDDRGGKSSISWFSTSATFRVEGKIEPVPNSISPGTAGMVLQLAHNGEEFDISQWDGIMITIRSAGAPLLLRIHTKEIRNGDYFAARIPGSEEMRTYVFPFNLMGQVMSAQQPWQGVDATGVELINWSFYPQDFDWELDSLSFYRD